MAGLNHALALIKMEQLGITYDEALKLIMAENEVIDAGIRAAIINLDSKSKSTN